MRIGQEISHEGIMMLISLEGETSLRPLSICCLNSGPSSGALAANLLLLL